MEYKKVYTDAELSELVAWFDARQDKLPKEFDLLPGVHISNMHDFILAEKEMIELHHDNPTYGATFCLLFRLRENCRHKAWSEPCACSIFIRYVKVVCAV